GHLFGRLQRYVNEVKSDISREMELEELRKVQQEVTSAARDLEQSVSNAARDVESGVRDVETQLNSAGQENPEPAKLPELTETQPSPAPAGTTPEPARQPSLPGFEAQ
ncbi:MAG: twin-arginine translocase subunit TatB, partial [Burkholderiales bacterium]|nr:twin-arginine translocase subunit TatB [Burkholderiales bacterium]